VRRRELPEPDSDWQQKLEALNRMTLGAYPEEPIGVLDAAMEAGYDQAELSRSPRCGVLVGSRRF
jgi:hypothetical protein